MDTSETYIKMCEKTEEIQDNCRVKSSEYPEEVIINHYDYYYSPEHKRVDRGYSARLVSEDALIWLPCQDQLQEMVAVKDSTYANIEPFADFAIRQGLRSSPPQFRSMEQLWLAFVMKEKYSKVWNGSEWTSG